MKTTHVGFFWFFSDKANVCGPNSCGPNMDCFNGGESGFVCQCRDGYVPLHRPDLGCTKPVISLCTEGACGQNALCTIQNDQEFCACKEGFSGNPIFRCDPVESTTPPQDPCQSPSPCGPNSYCTVNGKNQALCTCENGYFGDPTSRDGCKPECSRPEDCSAEKTCIQMKCRDPCPGACGISAECFVQDHRPFCQCLSGLVGDPLTRCYPEVVNPPITQPVERPKPECVINADCPSNKVCSSASKCRDPCPGRCGVNAACTVYNHVVDCSCKPGYVGNAYSHCQGN